MTRYFAADPTELGLSVSALVYRGGEVLLMRRSDNGHWGLPGGFVEKGESVAAAARREVEEETGYTIELGRLIGVYSDPATQIVDYGPKKGVGPDGGDRRIHVVNLCFEARALEAGTATTPDETLEIGFFDPRRLPEPLVPIQRIRIEDGLAGREAAAVR
ncbi:MAG: NUDIX domain-containing protein [Deltaproteobacteria bacterium]|nr:NUDIX domain-containing protein [Deltaproteobacteria bacterium]